MATPMTSPPPLKHFDFEATITLNTMIGRGQSCVYEGTMGGREIAVKKMNCDKDEVPEEVKLQHSLSSHPNILPLLGVSHSKDMFTVYILMERANMSLHQYLYREKRKPASQLSLDWAQQIARGLHHIHQHGLAHRDLKSANVLLFENQNILKICDFGSAKVLNVTATKTGEAGTFRWMAPEFIEQSKKINQRCDMFSYGMILYEIYAHEVPFSELKSEIEVALFIRDKKRPSIPSKLPKYLKTLIAQCWEHSAYDRPTSSDILMVLEKGAQFLQATESGDVERVKQMVAEGVDVNTRNEKEETTLHIASRRGDLNIVRVLIGAKAGIDLQEKDGRTPLYLASWNGHLPVVELLLKEKADITIRKKNGASPLNIASHYGHTQTVELLLREGADPNLTRTDGVSPLFIASQEGHTQIVELLLREGADPNLTRTTDLSAALDMSATNGHVQVVQKLLQSETTNINHQDKNGGTALFYASWNGHLEVVRLLLQAGAVDTPAKSGNTALSKATDKDHHEVVTLLKKYLH